MSLDALLGRAGRSSARLLLAGGDPERLERAAARLRAAGLRSVAVVGPAGVPPDAHPRLNEVAALLRSRAPERVRDAIHALDLAVDPLRFALGLGALGEADAVLAGPGLRTAALVEAAQWALGPPPGGEWRSTSWLLLADGRLIAFADCALPAHLDADAQARLARSVSELHARIAGEEPRVAILPATPEPLAEALRFRGRENVFIFPGGIAGSIALGLAQSLAQAHRLGPLLLGPPGVQVGMAEAGDAEELVGTAAATVLAASRAGT